MRVGYYARKKIEIPKDVSVELAAKKVIIKGPKGAIEKDFNNPRFNKKIVIEKNGSITVKTESEDRKTKAVVGAIAAHIKNAITGVTSGYKYSMKIFYSHFPMSVTIKGDEIQIKNFLGEKGARLARIVGDSKVVVDKDDIFVTGVDAEKVGQTCANIEQACKITKRDRRVFIDGIYIHRKFLQTGEQL